MAENNMTPINYNENNMTPIRFPNSEKNEIANAYNGPDGNLQYYQSSTIHYNYLSGEKTYSATPICRQKETQQDLDNKKFLKRISKTSKSTTTSNASEYKFQSARTDKRVSLNCTPLTNNTTSQDYIQRLRYVLGEGQYRLNTGQTIYGFLNSTLSKSCGLIFPYTPQISIQHSVNYENVDITHSNLSYNFYKNTPPPSITIDALFTADTRANALHMLSALWFLRAVTKCDFGERAYVDKNKNAIPGMPPPILYLNGYNQIMDNIPVVVTSFSYTLPKDKDYVSLGVNLDSNVQAFYDRKLYSDVSTGNFFDNFDGNMSGADGMKYLNGVANSIKSLQETATIFESNRYNNFFFNNWLPTELTFNIQLKVQPNLLKYKKKFNLNWYKMGLFNLDDYKGGTTVYTTNNNTVLDVTNSNIECGTLVTIKQQIGEISGSYTEKEKGWYRDKDGNIVELSGKNISESISFNKTYKNLDTKLESIFGKGSIAEKDKDSDVWKVIKEQSTFVSDSEVKNELSKNIKPKVYKFDRSGWTW